MMARYLISSIEPCHEHASIDRIVDREEVFR